MPRRIIVALVAGLLSFSTVSCGSSTADVCGPIVHDRLDPGTGTHVLPGAPTPSYVVDPPTSGAHQPAPPVHGVQHSPIAKPIQVGILEEGHVLVQYHGLDNSDIESLEKLVSDQVVVAPATRLPDGSRVVATAWVTHQQCSSVDLDTLKSFISERAGKGPGH